MNILCLNTAFSEAHISLEFQNKTYFEIIDACSKHSENLLCATEKLFDKVIKEQKLKISSTELLDKIDVISTVVGPGSFTGLRISIATIKAILDTHSQIKSVAINSLELIAKEYFKNNKKDIITTCLDALSGFYFVSKFDSQLSCLESTKMVLKDEISSLNNLVTIEDTGLKNEIVTLKPSTLLELTKDKIAKQEFIKENELVPLYVRPSQAEANLKNASN